MSELMSQMQNRQYDEAKKCDNDQMLSSCFLYKKQAYKYDFVNIIQAYYLYRVMNGLKNLLPKGIFADANYTSLKKKSEDFKKSINTFVDHLQQINRIYQNYYVIFEKNISQLSTYFPYNEDNNPKFFKQVIAIFLSLNQQLRNFIQKQSNNQKPILQISDLFMVDYNMLVEIFHQKCREYSLRQQNLVDSCEEYFKIYRQMLNSIQSYKNSFMDVKIIYNKDEKIKRYNECVATYKNLEQDLAIINKKVEQLNKSKDVLAQKYLILERQLTNFTSSFASRYIDELKKFAECFFQLQNNKFYIIFDRLQIIDKINTQNFFISNINLRYQECIAANVELSECQYLPCFLYYSDYLKEQAKPIYKKMVVIYYQEISIRIQKRKMLDKKIIDYMLKHLKTLDKVLMESYRQTIVNFQKMRKKIGQVFGNRWISFYKIISSIFQNSIENTGRLMKKVETKIKFIQASISEQAAIFDSFLKDFKSLIDKYLSKKIFKKYTQQQKTQSLLDQQLSTTRQEIADISVGLTRQITKINQTILKSDNHLKGLYVSFLNDIRASISQSQAFCGQISQDYYQEDIYMKNYQLCTDEIAVSVKKQMSFFEEMPFSILKQKLKISFDGQFNKIEGFKKIKKPKELEQLLKQNDRGSVQIGMNGNHRETDIISISNSNVNTNVHSIRTNRQSQKQNFFGQNSNKYAQFLLKRIELESNQKFIKSTSCALSDKIILAGRIFVTSHRLFFHSKFNTSNIFFGETFIEIPKNDIKKIQKKASSLFINNAISITTVGGELFFISFLSRDKFFDILKINFEVNNQQLFFEEQQGEIDEEKEDQLQFEDDMKAETSLEREKSIKKQLGQFNYIPLYQTQFELLGLNPIKFLKLFELDQQMIINRTTFPSFTYYLKDLGENKQINIENWIPNPLDYLNTANIKEITPQLFTRKISSIVPLPNSGIPFMPKTSFTTQNQTLFINNKDKYIMQLIVKSNGVPYCDTFDLRYRKTVQKSAQNKVKMNVDVFVNFNQNVIVKSTIENKSIETSKQTFEKAGNEIKLYLKALQKKFSKNNKKETAQDKLIQQAEIIQQLEKQVDMLKSAQKSNQALIESQKKTIKYSKIAVVILALLVILQFMLLTQWQ